MSLSENLEKLSNACGVAGREEEVRNLMIKLMKPYADQVKIDKLENVIAIKKGKKNAPKVMLAAHMDEIGLMVKTINKEGFLQFAKMGGIDARILIAQKVTVNTANGPLEVGIEPIAPEERVPDNLTHGGAVGIHFIDIGAE